MGHHELQRGGFLSVHRGRAAGQHGFFSHAAAVQCEMHLLAGQHGALEPCLADAGEHAEVAGADGARHRIACQQAGARQLGSGFQQKGTRHDGTARKMPGQHRIVFAPACEAGVMVVGQYFRLLQQLQRSTMGQQGGDGRAIEADGVV